MRVFNNLSRELEDFEPIHQGKVNIYSCGPTVYDSSHIGHARSCITWDILYRYLKFKGYQVRWIRNITNIDDKIVNRANEIGVGADSLSRAYTYEFWDDMVRLNVSWPSDEPRATDYLPQMFEFVQGLIDKGFAYEAEGDVYFRVAKYSNYGQMKRQSIEDLRDGLARVDENSRKEDQLDFALWKSFPDQPETSFQSPWGLGRPGWHLECSTMIDTLLGDEGPTLDIHTGGDDLLHPHHENECAQSESLSGKALAKYWMHNGMVMVNGSKMSKSEGNFFLIKDLLAQYKANTIRYFSLSTHYKKQINFSHEALQAAEQGFDKLYTAIKPELDKITAANNGKKYFSNLKIDDSQLDKDLLEKFTAAMDDDMGTPQALALVFDNKDKAATVIHILDTLGFDLVNHAAAQADSSKADNALGSAVELLLEMRNKARETKDFALSDKIRDDLAAAGVNIKDFRGEPSTWELA